MSLQGVGQRRLTVVVKTSKFCNLRCTYCYEYDELDDRTQLTRGDLRALYGNIDSYLQEVDARDGQTTALDIVWHGGEPLLVEPAFYRDTFADQRLDLPGRPVANTVQTNLTVLSEDRLRLLVDDFDSVGVSFDVEGGLRVNVAGRDSRDQVSRNIHRLKEAGGRFGCITVLTAANIGHLDRIVDFYEELGLDFRLLPLFNGAFADQHDAIEVDNETIVSAMCHVFDRWLESSSTVNVTPLNEYTIAAQRLLSRAPHAYYDRRKMLDVLLVNTDGQAYLLGDAFDQPEQSIGNVFRTPLTELVHSPGYERSAHSAELRMAANCTHCEFFGGCDGNFAANSEVTDRDVIEGRVRACSIPRAVIGHIMSRLSSIPEASMAGPMPAQSYTIA